MVDHEVECNFNREMSDNNQNKHSTLFEGWAFGKTNYILFCSGVALLIIAYVLMARGSVNSFQSLTLAPLLLFISYIIIIPIALVYRVKKNIKK